MELYTKVKLNEIGNRLLDLCEREGVALINNPNFEQPLIKMGDDYLALEGVNRTTAYDDGKPPYDFDAFVNAATDLFVRKNTDYGSRYTRALITTKDPLFLWAWETEKKLDRLRSWIERGELLVKGEGVANSVQDIFNYTVLYTLFNYCKDNRINPLDRLKENDFYTAASKFPPVEWVQLLIENDLLKDHEVEVKQILLKYMGGL